jgi:hypothetical protein
MPTMRSINKAMKNQLGVSSIFPLKTKLIPMEIGNMIVREIITDFNNVRLFSVIFSKNK